MKKQGNYYRANIALNEKEHQQFIKTGMGIKKIFKAMLDALAPPETSHIVDEQKSMIIEEE